MNAAEKEANAEPSFSSSQMLFTLPPIYHLHEVVEQKKAGKSSPSISRSYHLHLLLFRLKLCCLELNRGFQTQVFRLLGTKGYPKDRKDSYLRDELVEEKCHVKER